VPTIRALRRSQGLTLVELALLAGIPARVLGEIEYGLLPLDADSRARLSPIFALAPESLRSGASSELAQERSRGSTSPQRVVLLLSVLSLGVLLFIAIATPTSTHGSRAAAAPTPIVATQPSMGGSHVVPTLIVTTQPSIGSSRVVPTRPTPMPTRTATPTAPPTPMPAFTLDSNGPHGCPLVSSVGHIVITQGYGEGTHAPALSAGALDLAIDGDGDGNADPDATRGVTVVATHGGSAHVFLGSWPGGNYVRVEDATTGWSTAYAHLDTVAVADGQSLADGATLGTVGSTGFASGPHLHYEVWRAAEHIDPTDLLTCK
jgi:transcriptional regulator with XRE-family HTH domain